MDQPELREVRRVELDGLRVEVTRLREKLEQLEKITKGKQNESHYR